MNAKETVLQMAALVCLSLVASAIELAIIDGPPPLLFAAEKRLKEKNKRPDRTKILQEMATYEDVCPDGKCDIEGLTVVVYVTLETAKKHYDSGEAQFVDAREKEKYRKERIPYYTTNLPLGAFSGGWPEELNELRETKELLTILYCDGAGCDSSQGVAMHLVRNGFKKIMIVEEGFPAWKEAKYPVETDEGVINE